ncbi:hypothetical protein BC793_1511, partial [Actinoplanes xinjiangensis]
MIHDLPNESELLTSIAEAAGATEEAVKAVLADAGVPLTRPLPAQRSLVIHHL